MNTLPKLLQVVRPTSGDVSGVVDQTMSSGEIVIETPDGNRTTYESSEVELDTDPTRVIAALLQYHKRNIIYPNPVIQCPGMPPMEVRDWSLREVESRVNAPETYSANNG